MKIALCGYMASGKSTVGQLVAEKLNLEFIEIDLEIQKKENLSIAEIFSQKGEIYFRKQENLALKRILKNSKNAVISLGGGTPCYANNIELLKADQDLDLVYLKLTAENIKNRLWLEEKNKRPLLSHLSEEKLEEYIRKHLFERQFYYLQSDFKIDANFKSVEQLSDEIIYLFK
ncbi:shikimate kinase [Mesonia aestuariivivens]|uniref:Shikimate kinase n=1 Tax=Mesonia aestuariivivens TaxID=2796128 RepID=A0ABS6W089_9FLAO|nr:shikimate kinase [Mesonia aestuariivivens]MBW2961254.1 shikimate kinase [Mesonia aestuariivivens]